MRHLLAFENITVDGYFTGPNGELDWAHQSTPDPEYDAFIAGNARGGGMVLLGRITYDMMAGWWPTPAAAEMDPVVAERMNNLPKVVFSRTLHEASWNNTTLVNDAPVEGVRRMKAESGPDMVILGSGTIVAQLARAGLIDEYHFVVNPIALGGGRTLFDSVGDPVDLRLTTARTFANGKVVLRYAAVR